MNGLDTNVLLRFLVQDDPVQTPIAMRLMGSLTPADPGWISVAALLEVVWVLGSRFGSKKAAILDALTKLSLFDTIEFENAPAVTEAIALYRSGRADFADCLIAATARHAGCTKIVTFDSVAARDAGMELLT